MFFLKAIVLRVTLLIIVNLRAWADKAFDSFLVADEIAPWYEFRSREGMYLDDFSKYTFEKRQRTYTTEGTTPTYSEYETEEEFFFKDKDKKDVQQLKTHVDGIIRDFTPSSETEFVGGWDEYPLFATSTSKPSTRENLRLYDSRLSKVLGNPQRYGPALCIWYMGIFHHYIKYVWDRIRNVDLTVTQLVADIGRGREPFFYQRHLDNDTLRDLGWTDIQLNEFFTLYYDVRLMLKQMKKEQRMQRYEVDTKEKMTDSEKERRIG